MRIATGFITIPGRHAILSDTLASFREACHSAYRIYSDGALTGCWQAWLKLLAGMVADPRGASHFLLCEDDVIFSRGLYDYLTHNPPPAGSIANLYCTSECHRPDLMRWHRQPAPMRAQGSLAILIPQAIAREILAAPPFPDRRDGTDHNLGTFCRQHGIPFVTHSPSLVLHATTETSLPEARGRDELRQAFCFAESINAKDSGFYPEALRSAEVANIGLPPADYFAYKLGDDYPSRRGLPPHPHTLAVFYRQAGA